VVIVDAADVAATLSLLPDGFPIGKVTPGADSPPVRYRGRLS